MGQTCKIAIIGAGMSGAAAGATLVRHGATVTLFEKARGAGGRCATRRDEGLAFDHGAQYFTSRDASFHREVERWAKHNVVEAWKPRIGEVVGAEFIPTPRSDLWVGTPSMSAVVKHMLKELDARFGFRVASIDRTATGWRLVADSGDATDVFDQLLVTVPAPQVKQFIGDFFPQASQVAGGTTMSPCWTQMLAFRQPLALPFDAAKVSDDGPIRWLARNSSKPGRPSNGGDCWVVHADHDWSSRHIEDDVEIIAGKLSGAFRSVCDAFGVSKDQPAYSRTHLWRHALASPTDPTTCLVDASIGLALAGDWLLGGRIEAAWLSGRAAANALHIAARGRSSA